MNRKLIVGFIATMFLMVALIGAYPVQVSFANGSVVQSNFNSANSATSISTAYNSNVVAGNILVWILSYFYGATPTISDSQANAHTSQILHTVTCSGVEIDSEIWTATAGSSAADTVMVTVSGGASSPNFMTLSVYEVSGVTLAGLVTSSGDGGSGGGCTTPTNIAVSALTVGTSGVVIGGGTVGAGNSAGVTAATSFTLVTNGCLNYGCSVFSTTITPTATSLMTDSMATGGYSATAITFAASAVTTTTTTTTTTTLTNYTTTFNTTTSTTTTKTSYTTTFSLATTTSTTTTSTQVSSTTTTTSTSTTTTALSSTTRFITTTTTTVSTTEQEATFVDFIPTIVIWLIIIGSVLALIIVIFYSLKEELQGNPL